MVDKLTARELVLKVSNCFEIPLALQGQSHPCREVVLEQNSFIANESERQRPEPWVGNLETGKVLFISSNPSISLDPGLEREDFPNFQTKPEIASNFFLERFKPDLDQVHATFKHPTEPNFLTRSLDGKYRSGTKNPKKPQSTWANTHRRAVEILGTNCHPHFDYAITEIVHCKSKDAAGVANASRRCINNWMNQILELSTAKTIILFGSKVRDHFALPVLNFEDNFGSSKDYVKLKPLERSLRDIQISNFGGKQRLYVFNWHPVAPKMRKLETVYGNKTLKLIQEITLGNQSIPENQQELINLLMEINA